MLYFLLISVSTVLGSLKEDAHDLEGLIFGSESEMRPPKRQFLGPARLSLPQMIVRGIIREHGGIVSRQSALEMTNERLTKIGLPPLDEADFLREFEFTLRHSE
jgi:hypothetical protein